MNKRFRNDSPQTGSIHPAILKVTGDDTRRWCAAVWSVGPGKRQLIGEIRGLVENTLVAHWMQPPAQYEPTGGVVNSLDVLFWETPDRSLEMALQEEGWSPVDDRAMRTEEYEQFEAFQGEAKKAGRDVADRPEAIWRMEISATEADDVDPIAVEQRVAEMLDGEVWGETPGWFSKAYCETLRRRGGPEITPDRRGVARLQEWMFTGDRHAIQRPGALAFQAICDFVGVVLQSVGDEQVQWGTCPVDESTGFAPAPLFRIGSGGDWRRLSVGVDVTRRAATPWGRESGGGNTLVDLVDAYLEGPSDL